MNLNPLEFLQPEASDTGSVPLDYLSDTARNPLTWLAMVNPGLAMSVVLAQKMHLAKIAALLRQAPRMPGAANLAAITAGQFTQPTSIFDLGRSIDETLMLSDTKQLTPEQMQEVEESGRGFSPYPPRR